MEAAVAEGGAVLELQLADEEQGTGAGECRQGQRPEGQRPGRGAQGVDQWPEETAVAVERQQGSGGGGRMTIMTRKEQGRGHSGGAPPVEHQLPPGEHATPRMRAGLRADE